MSGKSIFIDMTKCTACRGCQVACKQWHGLPAEETKNVGSHQNPQDVSFNTYKLVRFKETTVDKKFHWLFFPEQCRHCIEPPCKMASNDPDAIILDAETGAVVFTAKTAGEDFDTIRGACPYNIPRQDAKTKAMAKCDFCWDRIKAGMKPACVHTCPTGAMNFGDLEDMRALAAKSLAEAKKKHPQAVLVNAQDVRVIYLAQVPPKNYYDYLLADAAAPRTFTRKSLLAELLRPAKAALRS